MVKKNDRSIAEVLMLYWDEQWSPHPVSCSCFRTCPCLSRRHHRLRCMSHQEVTIHVSTRMHGSWSRHGRVSLTSFASFQPGAHGRERLSNMDARCLPSLATLLAREIHGWKRMQTNCIYPLALEQRMVGEKQAGDLEPACRRMRVSEAGSHLVQVASYVCGLPSYMHRIGSFLPSLISATSVLKYSTYRILTMNIQIQS